MSSIQEAGRQNACPGEVVRYTCTVVDDLGGYTIWRGSAFDCESDDNSITLLHVFYRHGVQDVCVFLTAQGVDQNGTCFTSVLTLPAADGGMNGKTIECTLSGQADVGSDTLAVACK